MGAPLNPPGWGKLAALPRTAPEGADPKMEQHVPIFGRKAPVPTSSTPIKSKVWQT
jgi:hypothetical protein